LTEAYQDTRQAIDGLRMASNKEGMSTWLRQIAADFEEYTTIQAEVVCPDNDPCLPPEVQAQLIRIVQEALSNVRKHANATQVEIACSAAGDELVLEIRDNGQGFSPVDIPGPSQHGLRGMRERADLIGAEFQVVSRPTHGATVSVHLPLEEKVSP
jgi:two-component system nitrate/nitrite sensor histidine kinase NarX